MSYKILMREPVGQHWGEGGDVRTDLHMDIHMYVRDGFPHKDFIGHQPLWEPMPKKGPRSKQDQLELRNVTFYTINQISKGPTPGWPIGRPGVFGIWRFQLLSISYVLNE
jgi:hypothetical protein